MASSGIQNGTDIAVYVGGTKISDLISNSESWSMSPRDATSKDSSGNEEILEGLKSATFSAEGYFSEDATNGYHDLWASWNSRADVTVLISTAVSGDETYSQTCKITSLERSASVEDSATFTVEFQRTGATTNSTV